MIPYLQDSDFTLYNGEALAVLQGLPAQIADCVISSPPYWALRDYQTGTWEGGDPDCTHVVGGQVEDNKAPGAITSGIRPGVDAFLCRRCGATRIDQQLGLEPSPEIYVARLVEIFREVKRVLADHGTIWLNLGSSYEAKDMVPTPWMVVMALRADGWYLRRDVIWEKTNGMPESAKDRPTTMHEYVFMLTKQGFYFWDRDAAQEPAAWERWGKQTNIKGAGWITSEPNDIADRDSRNIRSVWRGPTASYSDAHFAVMPEWLAERCITLSTKPGGIVLDPFGGAGTTALAARNLERRSILIELSADNCRLSSQRLQQLSLLAELG